MILKNLDVLGMKTVEINRDQHRITIVMKSAYDLYK